jgi:hypothetical protein
MTCPAQFSHQVTRLQFPADVHFGADQSIWIAKVGDIARGNMYLRVDWPAPATVDDSAGTRMIDFVELRYGAHLIERHYGESIELMNDIMVPQAKQQALSELMGKHLTSNLASYYIQIPFHVDLPLCALEHAPIFRVSFRNSNEFSSLTWTGAIQVNLFVDYVYVTQAERNYFKSSQFDFLTHTMQRVIFTSPTFITEFTRPIKELYWVVQAQGAPAYQFSNIISLNLKFNGIEIIKDEFGIPLFLQTIQGLENHTRVPDRNFYMYSFALDPENRDSTGEINMTAVTRQLHTITLDPSVVLGQIRVYAVTHQVVRISQGSATPLFTLQEGGSVI